MTAPLILAIDQGTTNTKAILVEGAGRIVGQASRANTVHHPHPGWAEQSAEALWEGVQAVIAEVVSGADPALIAGVAISNQRESIVVWDAATGRPIAPCVIWQCRRTADRCAELRAAGHEPDIVARTGLGVDPLFPAAKIAWILDAVPGARPRAEGGELRAGTVDSWLLWNLTGGAVHATDHSNASRTQLFNTGTLAWDETLCALFGVPIGILPKATPSDSRFGEIVAGATVLPGGVPIRAVMGDSHAALYGHGVRQPGTVKATYGTGSSLMTLTRERTLSTHGLSATIAWSTRAGVAYALEGNISVAGQAVAFVGQLLGMKDAAALAELAATVKSSEGVVFVPALVGLGAPHWRDDARGLIAGMSLGTVPAHVARAAVESVAFQVHDVFAAMQADLGAPLTGLSVDGGPSRNDMLMQFQADLLGVPVARGERAEVSALGVAAMAAEAAGLENSPATSALRVFTPASDRLWRDEALARWSEGLRRTLA